MHITSSNPPLHSGSGTLHHGHTSNNNNIPTSQPSSKPTARPISAETINSSKGGSKKLPSHLKGTFKPIFDGTCFYIICHWERDRNVKFSLGSG